MKRLPFILALGALVGCYDYDTFADDLLQTSCDKMQECEMFTDYFTYDDCLALGDIEDTSTEPWECADYDGGAAKDCVDEYAAIACEDLASGAPAICDSVCSNY